MVIDIASETGPLQDHAFDDRKVGSDTISPNGADFGVETVRSVDSLINPDMFKSVKKELCRFSKAIPPHQQHPWFLGRKVAALYADALGQYDPVTRKKVYSEASGIYSEAGDIYTFGVLDGGTMRAWHKFMPFNRQWGFDSFKGLPPESPKIDSKYYHPLWPVGAFKSQLSTDAARYKFLQTIGGEGQASLILGFFNESLTPTLSKEHGMRKAAVIDIDADLYVSAHKALDWVFASGLAKKGTLIVYDEFTEEGGQGLCLGECRAHTEIGQKYNVKFTQVSGQDFVDHYDTGDTACSLNAIPGYVRAFIVESIG